jgi:two-component system copper resistance phosphate regulon response regulator CusR
VRILLVEDESKVSAFVARNLIKEKFTVDIAADGSEALQKAAMCQYDMIILDLMLPKVDGKEVLRQIRANDTFIPVLVLTAQDALSHKVSCFDAGADDYLTKPFELAELLLRVKALLRRGPVNRASSIRIADLELDRLTQQVQRGGRRIDLTATEYSLLEFLMANAGRVLSRAMIIEHVWDQNFYGITNIVDVYVGHLRSKIDLPDKPKLIHTIRGGGYTLNDDH